MSKKFDFGVLRRKTAGAEKEMKQNAGAVGPI
jgi:hypothetical protein